MKTTLTKQQEPEYLEWIGPNDILETVSFTDLEMAECGSLKAKKKLIKALKKANLSEKEIQNFFK